MTSETIKQINDDKYKEIQQNLNNDEIIRKQIERKRIADTIKSTNYEQFRGKIETSMKNTMSPLRIFTTFN